MNTTPPHEAMNRYLKDKSTDVTDSTLSNYQTTLNVFCDWLTDKGGVENLNELTSDEIQRFKEWRLENVQTITLKTDMTCIKGFIRFCEHINAVPDGMSQLVRIPKPNPEDEVSDDILTRDEATEILDYLEKHEYASLRHVIFAVLWKAGCAGVRCMHSISATSRTARVPTCGFVTDRTPRRRSRTSGRVNATFASAARSPTWSVTTSGSIIPTRKTTTDARRYSCPRTGSGVSLRLSSGTSTP